MSSKLFPLQPKQPPEMQVPRVIQKQRLGGADHLKAAGLTKDVGSREGADLCLSYDEKSHGPLMQAAPPRQLPVEPSTNQRGGAIGNEQKTSSAPDAASQGPTEHIAKISSGHLQAALSKNGLHTVSLDHTKAKNYAKKIGATIPLQSLSTTGLKSTSKQKRTTFSTSAATATESTTFPNKRNLTQQEFTSIATDQATKEGTKKIALKSNRNEQQTTSKVVVATGPSSSSSKVIDSSINQKASNTKAVPAATAHHMAQSKGGRGMPRQPKSAPCPNNPITQQYQQKRGTGSAQTMMAHPSSGGASLSVVGGFGTHANSKQLVGASGNAAIKSLQNPKYPVAQRYMGRQPVRMSAQIPRINLQGEAIGNIEDSQEADCVVATIATGQTPQVEESCENYLVPSKQQSLQTVDGSKVTAVPAGLSSKESQRSYQRRHLQTANIMQCQEMAASYNQQLEATSLYQATISSGTGATTKQMISTSGKSEHPRRQSTDGSDYFLGQRKYSGHRPIMADCLPPIASPQKFRSSHNTSGIADRHGPLRLGGDINLPSLPSTHRGSLDAGEKPRGHHKVKVYRKGSNHTQLIPKAKASHLDVPNHSVTRRSMALLSGANIDSSLGGVSNSYQRQAHSVKRTVNEKLDKATRQSYYACRCRLSVDDSICPDHLDGPATIHQYRQQKKSKPKTLPLKQRDQIVKENKPAKIIKSSQINTSGANSKKQNAAILRSSQQAGNDHQTGFGDAYGGDVAAMHRTQLAKVPQHFTPQKRKNMQKTVYNARGGAQRPPKMLQVTQNLQIPTNAEESKMQQPRTREQFNMMLSRHSVGEKSSHGVGSPQAADQESSQNSFTEYHNNTAGRAEIHQAHMVEEQSNDGGAFSPDGDCHRSANAAFLYIEQNSSIQQSSEKEKIQKTMRFEKNARLEELQQRRLQEELQISAQQIETSMYQSPYKSVVQGRSMNIEQQMSPQSTGGWVHEADRHSQLQGASSYHHSKPQTEVKGAAIKNTPMNGQPSPSEGGGSSSLATRPNILKRLNVPANSLVKEPTVGQNKITSSPLILPNLDNSDGKNVVKLTLDLTVCEENKSEIQPFNNNPEEATDSSKDRLLMWQPTKVLSIEKVAETANVDILGDSADEKEVEGQLKEEDSMGEKQTTPRRNENETCLSILQSQKMNSSQAQLVDRSPEIDIKVQMDRSNLVRQQSHLDVTSSSKMSVVVAGQEAQHSYRQFKNQIVDKKRGPASSAEEEIRSEQSNSEDAAAITSQYNITNLDRKESIRDSNSGKICQRKQQLKEVKRGKLLGEGSFGQVYQGLYDGAQSQYSGSYGSEEMPLPPQMAIKVIQITNKGLMTKLQQEYELMSTLKHENIVQCYGCLTNEMVTEASFFMELMPNSLQNQYRNFGPLHERVIKHHTKQILSALHYLHTHELRVIHGDLKAANILSDKGKIKLTDFGDSRRLETMTDQSDTGAVFNDFKGSLLWMAPECFTGKPIGRRSDIWSLGCTLIELASGQHPWNGIKDVYNLFEKLENQEIPDMPQTLSETCKDFIKQCLVYDKSKRLTAQDLLNHDFVRDDITPQLQPSQQNSMTGPPPQLQQPQ